MLTVSNYHYIREDFNAPFPSIFGVTPAAFENQIVLLKATGQFITPEYLADNIDFILNSDENYILVTFDDGLKEQYEVAKPILDKHNIKALYFVNSINHIEKEVSLVHKIHLVRSQIEPTFLLEYIETKLSDYDVRLSEIEKEKAVLHYNYDDTASACLKYLLNFKLTSTQLKSVIDSLFSEKFDSEKTYSDLYMNQQQLQDLANGNMLGSHTHSHFALGLLSPAAIESEMSKTIQFLNSFKKNTDLTISYPYGAKEACSSPVPETAAALGHKIGFTMERGSNVSDADKLLLKRFDCNDLLGGKNYNKN
jgi:peptidoglycan/xylan/chitin deacetylase (PgdA/CDA1 family)